MGKTSLIRAVLEPSTQTTVVGWGTCWHGEGAPGFWPWMQAFDGLPAVGRDVASAQPATTRQPVGPDPRARSARSSVDDPDRNRLLLLDAAVRWLERLADDRPVVVVLDDLQWADSSTLDLLDYLVAAPRRAAAGGRRLPPRRARPARRTRLATLGSRADHIRLGGLTLDGVRNCSPRSVVPSAPAARPRAPRAHRRAPAVRPRARPPARGRRRRRCRPRSPEQWGAGSTPAERQPTSSRRRQRAGQPAAARRAGGRCRGSPAGVVERLDPALDAGLVRTAARTSSGSPTTSFARRSTAGWRRRARASTVASVKRSWPAERGARAAGRPRPALRPRDRDRRTPRAIHWANEAAVDERSRLAFSEAAGHLRRVRMRRSTRMGIDPDVLARLLIDEADDQARSGDPEIARGLLAQAARPRRAEGLADVALAVQRLGAKFAARATRSSLSSSRRWSR